MAGWLQLDNRSESVATMTKEKSKSAATLAPNIASVVLPEKPKVPEFSRKTDMPKTQENEIKTPVHQEVTKMVSETVKRVQQEATVEAARSMSEENRAVPQNRRTVSNQRRTMNAGLEILDDDFVVSLVENIESDDHNDVTMRIIGFNELLRRESLDLVNSNAMADYGRDEQCLYGKDIQCEAIKELARRTAGL